MRQMGPVVCHDPMVLVIYNLFGRTGPKGACTRGPTKKNKEAVKGIRQAVTLNGVWCTLFCYGHPKKSLNAI